MANIQNLYHNTSFSSDKDGNVGIGTTSPSSFNSRGRNLVVAGSGDVGITIDSASTGSGTLLFSDGTGGTAAYRGIIEYDHANDSMVLSTSATERMRITSAGNVGIGTTLNLGRELLVKGEIAALDNTGTNDNQILMAINNTIGNLAVTYGSTGSYVPFQLETSGTPRFTVSTAGAIKFNAYGAGTLVSDASGNITVSSGGGAGGPYLPLSAGPSYPLTGTLYGTSTNFSGNGDYAGSMTLGTGASTAEASLTIGQGRTDSGYSYIDLVGGTTYSDYGLRIIRGNTGSNADSSIIHRGQGNLNIQTTDSASILLKTAGNEKMRITSTGNVGIGTTNPSTKLDVTDGDAQMMFGSASSARPWLRLQHNIAPADGEEIGLLDFNGFNDANQNTRYAIWVAKAEDVSDGTEDGSLTLQTLKDGTSTNTLTARSGKVGIGTTGVFTNNHILNLSGTGIAIKNDTNGSSNNWSTIKNTATGSGSNLVFQTATGTTVMDNSGNVGIGTTSPASKLNVGGNATGFSTAMQVWQDGETALSGDVGGKAATFFGTSGLSNSSIVNIYSTGVYTGQTGGEIGFGGKYASGGNVAQFAKIRSFKTNASNGGSNYGGGLELWTRPNGSAAVPRMTILGDGNVGIGTVSPDFKLQIATSGVISGSTYSWPFDLSRAGISSTRGFSIGVGVAGGSVALGNHNGDISLGQTFGVDSNNLPAFYETMRISHDGTASSGKVGIGTTSPGAQFNVQGTSTIGWSNLANARILSGTVNAGIGIDSNEIVSKGESLYIGTITSGTDIVMRAGGTTSRLQISGTNGNVGIGTTAPVAKLDVLGTSGGPTVFDYAYATSAGLRIHGDESAMDIVGTDSGNHASTILLRNGNEGFGLLNNPTLNTLQFRSFTATADGFSIHNTGSELSSLVDIITLEKTGNVGIGTTSPNEKLQLKGNGTYISVIASDNSNAVKLGTDSSGDGLLQLYSDAGVNNIKLYGEAASPSYINAGNVGIGTTSPSAKLSVVGDINFGGGNNNGIIEVSGSGDLIFKYKGSDPALTLDGGAVKTIVHNRLDALNIVNVNNPSNNESILNIRDDDSSSNGHIAFENSSEVTGIVSSGTDFINFRAGDGVVITDSPMLTLLNNRIGINTTSPNSNVALDVDGRVLIKDSNGVADFYLGNYATANHFRFHTNNANTYFDMNCGNIYWRDGASTRYTFFPSTANMTVNGTITQNSDARVKENIVEIGDCISKVQAMKGVYYNRTDFNTETKKVGVIAQDVEAVLPELIIESPEDGLKSVAYSELTAVLINAIKEQQEIIENLKTRITKLEN